MSKFNLGLTLILGLALMFSLTSWRKARSELQVVTAANETLRISLGDLTIVIAQKDGEIDHLRHLPCVSQEKWRLNSRKGRD